MSTCPGHGTGAGAGAGCVSALAALDTTTAAQRMSPAAPAPALPPTHRPHRHYTATTHHPALASGNTLNNGDSVTIVGCQELQEPQEIPGARRLCPLPLQCAAQLCPPQP